MEEANQNFRETLELKHLRFEDIYTPVNSRMMKGRVRGLIQQKNLSTIAIFLLETICGTSDRENDEKQGGLQMVSRDLVESMAKHVLRKC